MIGNPGGTIAGQHVGPSHGGGPELLGRRPLPALPPVIFTSAFQAGFGVPLTSNRPVCVTHPSLSPGWRLRSRQANQATRPIFDFLRRLIRPLYSCERIFACACGEPAEK